MQNIDSDLIRGNIDTIILKTMLNEDKYGLDIIKEVSDKSSGTYELKQPTLYSCLKRLENQELISSYWVDSEIGGKRHYYKLTDKGREFYNKKQEEWAKSKFIIDNLLSNYNYEEYRLVKKDDYDEIIQNKANAPLSSITNSDENNQTNESDSDELNNDEANTEIESHNQNSLDNEDLEENDNEVADNNSTDEENSTYSEDQFVNSDEFEEENLEDIDASSTNFSNDETENYQNQGFEDEQENFVDDTTENLEDGNYSDNEAEDDNPTYSEDEFMGDENDGEIIDYSNDNETPLADNEVFDLGSSDNNNILDDEDETEPPQNDDEDYPVYFSAKQNNSEEHTNTVSYETTDQSSNELNILSRLRNQDDEEINTYYGDQKSYINHLNQLDDSQIEQQNLLDNSLYVKPDLVNESIDNFSNAVDRLNNFNSSSDENNDEFEEETTDSEGEENDESQDNFNQTDYSSESEENDDLDELNKLKNLSSNAFFNSTDNSDYDKTTPQNDYDYNQTDSSDASFENDEYKPETISSMSFSDISNEIEPFSNSYTSDETNESEAENNYQTEEQYQSQDNMNDIDSIIANNITTSYAEPTQAFYRNQTTNYREKLSDLSKYSRVSLDNEKPEIDNQEGIEKAKDISVITKELEEEGIKVKEHYKSTNAKNLDKNYLLCNKINLMKSLIMFFGYVFILSAVYIVLNNTSMKENSWFSIKPFLIGLIPFAVILAYYLILFIINPYKKVDAKFHFRIMMFISIIITIQLLLITYCINLQLGFYSFSQLEYNHLFWIVPTIICFAPIIDNFVYLGLFKSKNFNV